MSLTLEIKDGDPKTIVLFWEGNPWRRVSKVMFSNELKTIPSGLSWEAFLEHFTLVEERVGKRYALYLLSRRALLSGDLQERLVSKGITPSVAQAVIQFCQEKGYVDDTKETSRLVAKEHRKGRSARATFCKLKGKKGVNPSLLEEHLASFSEEEALQTWFHKNGRKLDLSNPHEKRKVIAKLCRKGFSLEAIFKGIDDI